MIKILFAAFEADPFVKTGGLGDVAGSLPGAVSSSAYEVRVILPKLSAIPEKFVKKMEFVTTFSVPLCWRNQHCGLFTLKYKGVRYYFLDNEYYFKRDQVYGEYDDAERVAFFSKAVLESLLHMDDYKPDIIHCNDWHTALVPVFLREQFMQLPDFAEIKTIFTIHNLQFQGRFPSSVISEVCGLYDTPAETQLISDPGTANFLQGAAIYSDAVTAVSPTYAKEICTPYYGEGLNWLFNKRGDSLYGILNGIDYKVWNPAADKLIPVNYDDASLADKKENKARLQEELGLEVNPKVPLFVIISRLTEQKGLDLVTNILAKLDELPIQLAVLGVGEYRFEEAFTYYSAKSPDKFAAAIKFDNGLSHRMYAGADVMLVPSRFEPCGLTQMISMRYGTLPLVRETGGLKDTVDSSNGFSFASYEPAALLEAVNSALKVWTSSKRKWQAMQKKGMTEDFSWKASAKEYRKLYSNLMKQKEN